MAFLSEGGGVKSPCLGGTENPGGKKLQKNPRGSQEKVSDSEAGIIFGKMSTSSCSWKCEIIAGKVDEGTILECETGWGIFSQNALT